MRARLTWPITYLIQAPWNQWVLGFYSLNNTAWTQVLLSTEYFELQTHNPNCDCILCTGSARLAPTEPITLDRLGLPPQSRTIDLKQLSSQGRLRLEACCFAAKMHGCELSPSSLMSRKQNSKAGVFTELKYVLPFLSRLWEKKKSSGRLLS